MFLVTNENMGLCLYIPVCLRLPLFNEIKKSKKNPLRFLQTNKVGKVKLLNQTEKASVVKPIWEDS